uniref:Uncharacterized protein n=1 Tax=Oryza brachyantha TaxID=4533 RepID=J3LAU0_ORYBR
MIHSSREVLSSNNSRIASKKYSGTKCGLISAGFNIGYVDCKARLMIIQVG